MGTAGKKSYRIEIIVALIGVVGVLGAAVISNWDKIFKEPVILPPDSHVEPDRGLERPTVTTEEPESETVLEEATQEQPVRQQEQEATRQPKQGDIVINSIGIKLVYISSGSFMMGSSSSAEQLAEEYDAIRWLLTDEFPQHRVRISKGFWMSQTEVTQDQYKSVMSVQPWSGMDGVWEYAYNPAVYVNWNDAVAFCQKLSQKEGKTYRLPTEAEWEYACRAGTTTRFSFGDSDSSLDDYAWCESNTEKVGQSYAHPVGQKKPNPWGLYDMHGNVYEWCSDFYDKDYYSKSPSVDPKGPSSGTTHSFRSGSWSYFGVSSLRCSERNFGGTGVSPYSSSVGFRVVRSQP